MRFHLTSALAACVALLGSGPATAATYEQTFVSGIGSDTNNTSCQLANPCATIAHALTYTIAKGEIVVTGDVNWFSNGFTIDKSVVIRGSGVTPTIGGVVISAGPTDRVELHNLHIKLGSSDAGFARAGVTVNQAADVLLADSEIDDSTFNAEVFVYGYPAVDIKSTSSARVTLEHVKLFNNIGGVLVEGNATGHLKLFNSLLVGNTNYGVQVVGTGNDALIANTQVLGSTKGVSLLSGGKATSYGNNVITSGDAPVKMPFN
jgi:hypothetical protein